MGTKKANSTETKYADNAIATQNTAAQRSPLELERENQIKGYWDDLNAGKDVKDIGFLNQDYNLYNNSVNNNQEYSGEGLLGKDNQLAGANGQMMGLIGKQLSARKQQQASGDLYNAAQQAYQGSVNEAHGIADADTQQRMAIANLANQRYTSYVNRPKQPSFWQQMLTGFAQGAGQAAAAGG